MRLGRLLLGGFAVSAGLLLYGGLVEAHRLRYYRSTLPLKGWPTRLDGLKVVLLADLHLSTEGSVRMAQRAVRAALSEEPDLIVLPGDLLNYWRSNSEDLVLDALAELALVPGHVLATPGNHDYFGGNAGQLGPILEQLGIPFLQNQSLVRYGVNWVGVDSAAMSKSDPVQALRDIDPDLPTVVIWHEGDAVEALPEGPRLMLSGHSHGGQFVSPWGWAPAKPRLGRKYQAGWYPQAPIPLYVSRGVGTTGPPSRLFCAPEVSVLTLASEPER